MGGVESTPDETETTTPIRTTTTTTIKTPTNPPTYTQGPTYTQFTPKTTQYTPTYPEITIIREALRENDNKLQNMRYNLIDKQVDLNNITNRLNNLNFNLSSLNKKSKYTASGELTFY